MAKGIATFKFNGSIGTSAEWVRKALDKPRMQPGSLTQITGSNEYQLRNPDGSVSILHSGNYLVKLDHGQIIVATESDLKAIEGEEPHPFIEGHTTQPAPENVVNGDEGEVADQHVGKVTRTHKNVPAPPVGEKKSPHSGMNM